jgi:hypothetical protein
VGRKKEAGASGGQENLSYAGASRSYRATLWLPLSPLRLSLRMLGLLMELPVSETLIGVLIGGILSGIGTWITLAIQHRRWRTELRISHLKEKRERLELVCQRTLGALPGAIHNNSYPADMMSDIDFLLPAEVSRLFEEMMSRKDKIGLDYKHFYYNIAREMKKSVRKIDQEIDDVANGKMA